MDTVFWFCIGLVLISAHVLIYLHAKLQNRRQEARVKRSLSWANEDEHYQGVYDNLRRHGEACALVLVANEREDDDGSGVRAEI